MSSVANRGFDELAVGGSNYMTWALDVVFYLASKGLSAMIVLPATNPNNQVVSPTEEDNAKVVFFL